MLHISELAVKVAGFNAESWVWVEALAKRYGAAYERGTAELPLEMRFRFGSITNMLAFCNDLLNGVREGKQS
jgi:hypothetical protein